MSTRTQAGYRCALIAAALTALTGAAQADPVYAVTSTGTLASWDIATPGTVSIGPAITGLAAGESLTGIDFRPATGGLYGLGSSSTVYVINPLTGQATAAGGAFTPALSGSRFGFDFNPTVDRIRVGSDADQNLRLNPATGAVAATDTMLAYAAGDLNFGVNPNIVHDAYTNNFAGATTTTLYVIDSALNILATQNPPNNGTLNTVGLLGVDVTDLGGFDISGSTGLAYLGVGDAGKSTFWTVNLTTGQASLVGDIGGGIVITAMAVTPAPGSLGLLGGAGLLAGVRRRR